MKDNNIPEKIYHYTTQEGLLGIFKTQSLWATHIFYLNDSHESIEPARIARDTIKLYSSKLLSDEEKKEKYWTIERISDYVHYSDCMFLKTFVASFCQGKDLLSMWRGYGKYSSAYAIGFDTQKLKEIAENNNFKLVKCNYKNKTDYTTIIQNSILNTLQNKTLTNDPAKDYEPLKDFTDYFEISTQIKRDCFIEEQEWRLISTGVIQDEDIEFRSGQSSLIPYLKINLFDLSAISEIIVGPTQNIQLSQDVIFRLTQKYIKHALRFNIKQSEIPYRII